MDKRLSIEPARLGGLALVRGERFADHRGAFARLFCSDELARCSARAASCRPTIRAPPAWARCAACTSNVRRMRK